MASPGVSTKPILLISGYSPFCETFFDDVKVPKDQIVGELNKGWDVAKYLLGHEREMISGMGLGGGGDSLGAAVKERLVDNPLLRADVARFDVDSIAFRAMSERFIDELKAGRRIPPSRA
jgi:alkylation response protein AidB-like acyl-CoA dehydrogenase